MSKVEEFYKKAKGKELTQEQKKENRFTYYDMLGFASAYHSKQLNLGVVSKSKSIALADLIKENERAIERFDSLKKKYSKMETQDVIDLLKRQLSLLKEL